MTSWKWGKHRACQPNPQPQTQAGSLRHVVINATAERRGTLAIAHWLVEDR